MNGPERTGRLHYVHRLSYTTQERLVGAFVLAGVLLLFALAAFSREAAMLFADKFTIYAQMRDARGVTVDTQVLMSGVQVGRVKALEVIANDMISVELEMLERFHPLIREDARGALSKLSMIGKPSIEIRGGSSRRPEIEDGAVVPLTEPPDLDQIMSDVLPALRNVQGILDRLNQIAGAIEPQEVTSVTRNLGTASGELPELVAEAREVVAQMNTTMATVNYELQQLPDLVLRSRQVMERMDRTLQGVQGTWPVSSSMAPPSDKQIVEPRPLP